MADWVHCNTCFCQPGDGRKFSLTNCGHMYCSECLTTGVKDTCRMCGNPCTYIPLTSKMKPEVEVFFCDPIEIIKKAHKQLSEVMDFQKNHRKRLTAYRKEREAKQCSMKGMAIKQQEEIQKLQREIMKLREENAKLRSLVAAGSPGPGGAASGLNRPPTPGRILYGNSPNSQYRGQSPSPKPRSTSPYSVSKSPYSTMHQDASKTPQMQSKSVGPTRLSVRTPPVDGKMGPVRTPTSVHGPVSRPSSVVSMSSSRGRKTPTGLDVFRNNSSPRGSSPVMNPNRAPFQTPRRNPHVISPSYSHGSLSQVRSEGISHSHGIYPQKRPLSCTIPSNYTFSQP
ncbi:hypothetical protein HOLleu_12965 [Holothuria leucospilota]|uniref:RING-type domain-containing protein n=1 Tax=Holothuria leucospilota TaxID=206669 RepID=A0A9Q1CCE9_HOLLE|nr:hypothetical protein HOLleu_12965 [Holothuria leucospilota]